METPKQDIIFNKEVKKKNSFNELIINFFKKITPLYIQNKFIAFDKKLDGAITFFFKHYGKTKFMVAMSKKAQVLGVEKLWDKGPKAFVYFFLFYLVRDTILYIIIPIFFAEMTS